MLFCKKIPMWHDGLQKIGVGIKSLGYWTSNNLCLKAEKIEINNNVRRCYLLSHDSKFPIRHKSVMSTSKPGKNSTKLVTFHISN